MTDAQKAAAEILEMLQEHGVTFVNELLFVGKAPADIEHIKEHIRNIIDRHMC